MSGRNDLEACTGLALHQVAGQELMALHLIYEDGTKSHLTIVATEKDSLQSLQGLPDEEANEKNRTHQK